MATLALAFAPASALAQNGSAGIVRYDHPVFHNGHRVLWHGAWRGGGRRRTVPKAAAPKAAAHQAARAAAVAKPGEPKPDAHKLADFSILIDSEDACAARLAKELVAALDADGANGHVVAGRTSPTALAVAIQNDSADLAIAPIDALIGNAKATASWRDRGPYIARLGAETVEIIAPLATTDVHALAGREVGFGVADSAGAATAQTLFSRLEVPAKPSYGPLAAALAELASGKLAAVVAVGATSSTALADFGKDGRFHILSIEWTPTLQSLYAPARLTAKDWPHLVGANDKIDTLAAPRALIALDAAPSSPRADHLAGFTKVFFAGFDKLRSPQNDATWRDLNLAAAAPWPRLRAAQAWIDLNASAPDTSLETFRAVAKTVGLSNGGLDAQDFDRLYNSLMQWRSEAQ